MSFELIFHPFHYHYNPTVNNNNNNNDNGNNGDNNNINRYSVVSLTWLRLFHNVITQ